MTLTARQRYEQALTDAALLLKQWKREDEQLIAETERVIASLKRQDEKLSRPEARQEQVR